MFLSLFFFSFYFIFIASFWLVIKLCNSHGFRFIFFFDFFWAFCFKIKTQREREIKWELIYRLHTQWFCFLGFSSPLNDQHFFFIHKRRWIRRFFFLNIFTPCSFDILTSSWIVSFGSSSPAATVSSLHIPPFDTKLLFSPCFNFATMNFALFLDASMICDSISMDRMQI